MQSPDSEPQTRESQIIQIRNLKKQFNKQLVIDSIELSIAKGERVAILGPSGSGKTTLIRMMLGALTGDAGEVIIMGKKMPNHMILGKIGYMPQNDALYGEISGKDNLMFFGGLMGLNGAKLKGAIDEMLVLVDLQFEGRKVVRHYSGGMKKRLSLAVALLHDPEILLLDEPTVGIDPLLRQTVWEELKRLGTLGKTLVITTHVMDEAERCKRAVLIHEGRIIADGAVDKLKEQTPDGRLESIFLMTKGGGDNDQFSQKDHQADD